MRSAGSLLICLALPAVLAAQAQPTVAEHIALGDSAHAALAPQQALGHYRAALAHDSTNYAALWKAGREAVDIAKQIEGKERVRFAKIIYDEGMKALECDSTHDGANHLIGAWHAEVKRLSGFEKFFAKALYGGGFLDKGNWEDAQKYLQKAVALKPQNSFHRLELGEVYVDVGKYSKAREQFTAIEGLPIADVLDHEYKQEAKQVLADIKGEKDES